MADLEDDPPCVVVLHEVWGPDSSIEGACKRLRKLGFATSVPDLYRGYERLLTPRNIRKATEVVWDLSLAERWDVKKVASEATKRRADPTDREVLSVMYDRGFRDGMMEITMDAVREAREGHRRVATLGFSLGGGLSLAAAFAPGHPDSAVAYCGEPPKAPALRGVTPTLAVCASQDELMNPLMPAFVEAALSNGLDLTVKTLPNTQHDFFNENMKDRYNRAAAEEAWAVTGWFLERTLGRQHYPSKR